jgi:predicted TIM-barrel fold metal-dependent hydrolase
MSRTFFDAHCHVFSLSHPNFLGFIEGLRHRSLEAIYSQVSSPNFLLTSFFSKGGERIRNLMSVMEMEPGEVFELMEDDLLGRYAKAGDGAPLLRGGELRIGTYRFDRLLIVPLVVDFAHTDPFHGDAYYDHLPPKRVETQVRELLAGIRHYRHARPGGFLEIRPFLGVNPSMRSGKGLAALVEATFAGWRGGASASHAAFDAMSGTAADREAEEAPPNAFAGIKLYPPLGFDPWPDEGAEREKAEWLYSFCEARSIPIVTHCDDQGFRNLRLEEAWRYSSPGRWRKILERHPGLRVDFAHFGMRWSIRLGQSHDSSWTEEIMDLMLRYEGVHADLSFNGCDAEYYPYFQSLIEKRSAVEREVIIGRTLFGSDFMVNLMRVRSYSDYLRLFADSPLSDEWKLRFGSENPARFLFG